MDDNIKKDTLVTMLQDRSLMWYIMHSNDQPNVRIAETQTTFNKEFSRPKLEMQSIIGFKEIMMLPSVTLWDMDQRLKGTIHEANMMLMDAQHHNYGLWPHLCHT